MCFGSSPPAPVAPAAAPPAPAPLAEAVTPLYGIQKETGGAPGYNANGTPDLMRDPSVPVPGGAGVGGTQASSSGIGTM